MEHDFFVRSVMRWMGKRQTEVAHLRTMFTAFVLIVGTAPLLYGADPEIETVFIRLFPDSERSGHAVVLAFPGEVYPQPHRVSFVLSTGREAYATPERVFQTVAAASRAGDVEAAAKAYAPELRDRFRRAEANRLEKQRGAAAESEAPTVDLLGWIRFGSYVSLVQRLETVQGKEVTGLTPPMKLHEDKWMICSELHDPRWTLLQEVIRNGSLPEPMTNKTATAFTSMVPLSSPSWDTVAHMPELTVLRMGHNYAPVVRLSRQPPSTEGDDPFVDALQLVFSQYASGDPEKILSILVPSERSGLTGFVQGSANSIASAVTAFKDVSLKEQILYGQYALALVAYSTARGGQEDWLAFARRGEQWFVTDRLRADPFVGFLSGKRYAFPKIAPILWAKEDAPANHE